MSSNGFREIVKGTEMARQDKRPDVLVNVYGNRPAPGAEFDRGFSDRASAEQAQRARRELPIGVYDHRR